MTKVEDLVFHFDDFVRCYNTLLDNSCEKEFLRYVSNQEIFRLQFVESINELKRLEKVRDAADKDIAMLDSKLSSARRLLDAERQQRKKIEIERDAYANQLEEVRRILLNDPKYKIPDETKERLAFLSKFTYDINNGYRATVYDRLNTINELETTCSNVSDISVSRSEDDLDDESHLYRQGERKHRLSHVDEESATIKRKKSLNPQITCFTPTAPRADSIESLQSDNQVPEEEKFKEFDDFRTPAINRLNSRTHTFVSKSLIMPESCLPCKKKIRFGGTVLKCTDCNAAAHPDCRDKVPLPCVPMGTPSKQGVMGTISNYAPLVPPMIPAIVIHCINEVEQRGLNEIGIYRIPGVDRDVRELKVKFLKCKGAPSLADIDIHTVCSCLKDFLRSLRDALIPSVDWNIFAKAIAEKENKRNKLYQAISTLPQANRDTLAYIILHLQHVACSPACKMPISSLATIFGPTIVGYSKYEKVNALTETQTSNSIMEELLLLSVDYWSSFIVEPPVVPKTPCTLRNTPSTESLMRKTSRKFLTTPRSARKYFDTPPSHKSNYI